NDTPELSLTPVAGDFTAANFTSPEESTPFGYNKKTVEVTANWYFARKSSFKAGYVGEIIDRDHRDADHSKENGFIIAVDSDISKQLSFRSSYRYSTRRPDEYLDEEATVINGGITANSIFNRRFDEAPRDRNRGDLQLTYSPGDRFSISGFGGTVQDNYNISGGVNSATPLNFTTSTAG